MRPLAIGLLSVVLFSGMGCATSKNGKRTWLGHFVESGVDDYGSSDGADDWDFVGEIGRGGTPPEQDPDPWWKFIASPKARAIEKNVGVVY